MQKNTRNFHIRKKGVFLREMRHLGNNRFAKTVLLLCVLMQAVALMPHHRPYVSITAISTGPIRAATSAPAPVRTIRNPMRRVRRIASPSHNPSRARRDWKRRSPTTRRNADASPVRRSAELSSSIISRRSPCRASATLPVPNPISGFSSRPRYRAAPPTLCVETPARRHDRNRSSTRAADGPT